MLFNYLSSIVQRDLGMRRCPKESLCIRGEHTILLHFSRAQVVHHTWLLVTTAGQHMDTCKQTDSINISYAAAHLFDLLALK